MVASIRHQVICLVYRHHIWFCLADRLPVPTGRLARRNSDTSVLFPYPQLFYWAYALVETSVSSNPCCYYRAFFTVTLLFLASTYSPSQPAASKSRDVVARRQQLWPTPLPAQSAGREPRPDDVDESHANGVTIIAR